MTGSAPEARSTVVGEEGSFFRLVGIAENDSMIVAMNSLVAVCAIAIV